MVRHVRAWMLNASGMTLADLLASIESAYMIRGSMLSTSGAIGTYMAFIIAHPRNLPCWSPQA